MEMGHEALTNMIQAYRDKALDTFVRGLKGDLSRLLSIKEPVDLPQALHLCLKLQNVDYRAQYANNHQSRGVRPPLPPRRNTTQDLKFHQPFYPQLAHYPHRPQQPIFSRQPQPFQPTYRPTVPYNPQFQNKFQPPNRPQWAYPHRQIPRQEPMDVDPSSRSRQVNYMNRPQQNNLPAQKRVHQSLQSHPPNKHQRIDYTEPKPSAELTDPLVTEPEINTEIHDTDDFTDETLEEYADAYDNSTYDEPENLEDIYFLDSGALRSRTTNSNLGTESL